MVEGHFKELLASAEAQHDFDAVLRAHGVYLASMMTKSHVEVRPLMDGLSRLLRLCRYFTAVFNKHSNMADIPHAEVLNFIICIHFTFPDPYFLKVEAISARFRCDSEYFFLMLERTDAKELASRLDYNGWFSNESRAAHTSAP